jgi:1-acyl-sn-glycerol-3-phosphate acyltransferase
MIDFDDIRPYKDDEVVNVIKQLLEDNDFINSISRFSLPKTKQISPLLANFFIKKGLKKRLSKLTTINEVQNHVSKYVEKILNKSSDGLEVNGLEKLSIEKGYLFVSNHRDIVMDPAIISYLLHYSSLRTVEIAIGDNLLKKGFVSHLMRLNKSFIVKRSAIGREKLLATQKLSHYIHFSIKNGNNVWIAQKEGRAKDGLDKTDPTLIKMFYLSQKDNNNQTSIKEVIDKLNIIPVSISYEYDPCDEMKAKELFQKEQNGLFMKDENSDLTSISNGLNGKKGRIHIHFGQEITALNSDIHLIANQIDEQIVLNYKLFPSNYLAYQMLQKMNPKIGDCLEKICSNIEEINAKKNEFEHRLSLIDEELKPYFLKIYANAVLNKLKYSKKSLQN